MSAPAVANWLDPICCLCERSAPVAAGCVLCSGDKQPDYLLCPNECESANGHVFCARCLRKHVRNLHDWAPVSADMLADASILQAAAEDAATKGAA